MKKLFSGNETLKITTAKAHRAVGTSVLGELDLVELNLEFGSLIDK